MVISLLLLASKISIHALREESDYLPFLTKKHTGISIHALREESDRFSIPASHSHILFQSTLSARRATKT